MKKILLLFFYVLFITTTFCQTGVFFYQGSSPCCPGEDIGIIYKVNGYAGPSANWYDQNGNFLFYANQNVVYPMTTTTYYYGSYPSSNFITIVVTPLPTTPSLPTGPTGLCINSSNTTYTTSSTNATSYNWTLNPSSAGTLTASNNTVSANWVQTFSGNVSLTVTATNTCGTSSSSTPLNITVHQNKLMYVIPSASLPTGTCANIIADPSATQYLWSSGETTNNINACNTSVYNVTTTYDGGLQCQGQETGIFTSDMNNTTFTPNGTVHTIYEKNGNLYIGGDFNYIGPVCGYSAAIDNSTGLFDKLFPRINGQVNCVISDGIGGWYVGGLFSKVGSYYFKNLVHINQNKTIDLNFKPEPNDEVKSLLLVDSKIYVSGNFTMIGDVSRGYLAQIDISNGMATSWNPQLNGSVSSISIYDNDIIIGGNFTNAGGFSRNYLAAIDTVYAQATSWNPNPDQSINRLVLYGTKLYVSGNFANISGNARTKLACFLMTTETLTNWNPSPNNTVYDILPTTTAIYVCGDFTSIGGQTRNYLASVNTSSGTALTWNPSPNNTVYSILTDGTDVIVGGKFTLIGSDSRNCIAKILISSGTATSWNPDIHGIKGTTPFVKSLAIYGNIIYTGGSFYSMGGVTRNNAACYDIATDQLTTWNPNVNNIVRAICADDNYVYIGGEFTQVNDSITKNHLAQLNVSNAVTTGWNPNPDNVVYTLQINGLYLYVGGAFSNIGSNTRPKLAAIKLSDGTSSTWNPNPNNIVKTLSFSNDTLFIGGLFTQIGGQTRDHIAAFNITTGNILAFNPTFVIFTSINTVFAKNGKLYIGGDFYYNGGGLQKFRILIFDLASMTASSEGTTASDGVVNSIFATNSVVYFVGSLLKNNGYWGNTFNNSFSTNSSGDNWTLSQYWRAETNDTVYSVFAYEDKVFLGGKFTEATSVFQPFFVRVGNNCIANAHISDPFTNQFCEGEGVYLNADTNSHYSYQWYLDNVIVPGADSCSYSPVQTGTYTVKVTDNLNYGYLFSNGIHVTVDQLPDSTITPSGPLSFCGGSVVLNAATGTGYTYIWYKDNNPISGQTSSSYTATTSGNYYAEIYNSSGCFRNSQHKIVNVSGLIPLISASGNTAICNGDSVELSSDHTTGNLWYKDNISTGVTTQNFLASSAGVYKCFVDDGGCSGYSQEITVTELPVTPAPTATTTYTYCQNATSTQLTATGNNLLWYSTQTGGTGSATAPTPSTAGAGITHYYVSQTVNGCESSRNDIAVTVNATPAMPTATTSYTYCQNATATQLTATGNNLLWYTTQTGGTGNTTAPTPSTTSAGITHYYVSQTVNGCESSRNDIAVTVNATPATPTATTNYAYCQDAVAIQLSATGNNLLWYTTQTGGTGSSTAPIPSTTATGTTHFYVSQTVNNCESPRTDITVTVSTIPTAPTATTSYIYCQNSTATQLTANGINLLWYTTQTGGTGSSTAPTPSTTAIGTIHYFVSQTVNGCEGARTDILVNVNALPSTPTITPVGVTTFCQGGSVTLNAPVGFSYLWSNNSASQSINATVTGSYTVQIIDGNNCYSMPSSAITVTALPLPSTPTITYTGSTNICQGSSITLNAPVGYLYNWSNNSTNQSITVSLNGTYSVQVTDGNNCQSLPSPTVTITVNPIPPTPVITQNLNTLTSNTTTGNQWYNQNGLINGETNQNYTATTSGDYFVIVTLLGCSSDSSNFIHVVISGISNSESDKTINIYPNPVSNELILEFKGNTEGINFEIINSIGQVVFSGSLQERTVVQTSNFAAGVYLIKLENGNMFEFKKIVKN